MDNAVLSDLPLSGERVFGWVFIRIYFFFKTEVFFFYSLFTLLHFSFIFCVFLSSDLPRFPFSSQLSGLVFVSKLCFSNAMPKKRAVSHG